MIGPVPAVEWIFLARSFARGFSPGLREDLASGFLMGVVQAAARVDPNRSEDETRAFLWGCGRWASLRVLRKEIRQRGRCGSLDEWGADGGGDRLGIMEDVTQREPGDIDLRVKLRLMLREVVASLPEREKSVIVDVYGKGMTQQQSADRLGVSGSAVGKRIEKALARMGKRIRVATAAGEYGFLRETWGKV